MSWIVAASGFDVQVEERLLALGVDPNQVQIAFFGCVMKSDVQEWIGVDEPEGPGSMWVELRAPEGPRTTEWAYKHDRDAETPRFHWSWSYACSNPSCAPSCFNHVDLVAISLEAPPPSGMR